MPHCRGKPLKSSLFDSQFAAALGPPANGGATPRQGIWAIRDSVRLGLGKLREDLMAKGRYWREISAVLLLKFAALALLYVLVVAPESRSPMTPDRVAQHLAGSSSGLSFGPR